MVAAPPATDPSGTVVGVAKPLTDDEREEIIGMIRAGRSARSIAAETGRSTSTISNVAKSIGHQFGRANLARAQDARRCYSAERRAEIAARLVDESALLLDQLHGQHLVFNFGGKDNTYEERTLDEPPVEAKRALMQSVRDGMRTVLDIARLDEKADEGQAKGLLERLVDGLADVADAGS